MSPSTALLQAQALPFCATDGLRRELTRGWHVYFGNYRDLNTEPHADPANLSFLNKVLELVSSGTRLKLS